MPSRRAARAKAATTAAVDDVATDDVAALRAKLDASERMRAKMRESLLTLKSAYEGASCALKARVTPKVAMPSECAREISMAKAEATAERLRRMEAEAALEKSAKRDAEAARALARARDELATLERTHAQVLRNSGLSAYVKSLERENAGLKAEIEKLKTEAWTRAEETRSVTDAARRAAGQTFVAALPGVVRERLDCDDSGDGADALPSTSASAPKKRKSAAQQSVGLPTFPSSSKAKAKAKTKKKATAAAVAVATDPLSNVQKEQSLPGEGEAWTARPPPPLAPLASLRRPAAKSPARAVPVTITRARPRTTKGKSKSTTLNALKAQAEKTKRAFSAPK